MLANGQVQRNIIDYSLPTTVHCTPIPMPVLIITHSTYMYTFGGGVRELGEARVTSKIYESAKRNTAT